MTDTTENPSIAFNGVCAFAVSVGGAAKAPEAKPQYTLTRDGVTYGFLGAVPRLLFRILPGSAERAQRYWSAYQHEHPSA
ncbi:hypothetical protein [Nocardioides sp.]|uniref:hypothetical protein n=1 Tax=Nocardioides sp. TaxID=35761 RepID=UPI002602268D|nr:hypothetical protein [Nocardioides sp.]